MPVRTIAVLLCALALSACTVVVQDRRDTQWDPTGRTLFDQLPNHIDRAHRECCSVLSRSDFLKNRCDTDRPVKPRTNRC